MDPLTVPGTLESLDDIGKYARDAAEAAGLSKAATYKLRLAVDEIATNIVMHAYGNRATAGKIVVRAEIAPAELVLSIEDTGPEYDPRTAKPPSEEDLARPLEERKVGGLGLFLTLRSVDGFDYRREGNGNKTILIMRRSGEDGRKS